MSDEVNAASQQPKLKRLASKPLRLAQNTFNSLSSRSTTPLPSGANTAYSSTVALPDSSSTILPVAQSGMPRSRIGRRRRHHKLDEQALTPAQIAAAAKAPSKPIDGEEPVAVLRVRVVEAEGLVAKDRSGSSDPFITLVVPPSSRQSTPVIKKSLNPVYPPKDSTFDFPLYLSLASLVGGRGLEGVIWDKDLMRKEYMGEIAVPILDWFDGGDVKLWDDNLPTIKRKILSTRRRQKVSGTVTLQIGFVPPKDVDREEALKKVKRVYGAFAYQAGVPHGMVGVLGVPATEGVGTIKIRSKDAQKEQQSTKSMLRSAANAFSPFGSGHHKMQPVAGPDTTQVDPESDDDDESSFEDDGMTSSSSESDDEDFGEDHFYDSPNLQEISEGVSEVSFAVPEPNASDKGSKSAELLAPSVSNKTLKQPARQSSLPGYFEKKVGSESPSTPGGGTPPEAMTPSTSRSKMPKFRRTKSRTSSALSTKTSRRDFNFDVKHAKEMLGIVIMEIKSAEDLPKLKSSLRVTYDMDPFVVISFGKKVFRTRVIRHSLNPTWDEKMLFHVRRHEANYTTQFTVLDWDKVSGNDMVGSCTLPLSELIADAPKPDPATGLYGEKVDGKHEMKEFTLPLVVDKDASWEHKYSPKLTIRAKYEPYDALRQRFWRQYMTQYDADDTGKMSYTELTAMLDSLGSTLTKKTLESYFSRCGKSVDKDELTFDEVVKCFEAEVIKDHSQKEKAVNEKPDELGSASGIATPANGERGEPYTVAAQPANAGLDVTGPQGNISSPVDAHELAVQIKNSRPRDLQEEDDNAQRPGNQRIASVSSTNIPAVKVRSATIADEAAGDIPQIGGTSGVASPSDLSEEDGDISSSPPDDRERIINIRSCPLCHRRRLGKRSEQDIVTHLAICASADWSRVDRIVTANYVTSSQAQRKFFTKLVNKVAIGAYSLGANSANILVQDRLTGQLQEEKMAVYVRLGIRVLYKGAKSRMEGARARKLLKSLSVKQGIKYDSPTSALDIPSFIAFHNLPVNEILDPLDSFKTFNEFFYRKLKPEARPVDAPGDDHRLVSCADCRMMAFETVSEATKIWIKGREFSVGRLLGPNYKDVADRYQGGALGIFRLAPQDYHRFHSPVKGTVGKMTLIDGEYYTVNPQAIRTSLDVYGENVRKVVPVQSEEFGLVMTVWVGAMMVGSILTSVEEGQHVERADELGYFAFGGSTIVCLFEKGALAWDDDLLDNGRASIETLVRMGMGLGRSTKSL